MTALQYNTPLSDRVIYMFSHDYYYYYYYYYYYKSKDYSVASLKLQPCALDTV